MSPAWQSVMLGRLGDTTMRLPGDLHFPKSIEYLQKSRELSIITGQKDVQYYANKVLGVLWTYTEDNEQSLAYFNEALKCALELGKQDLLAEVYFQLGQFFYVRMEWTIGLKYSLKAQKQTHDSLETALPFLNYQTALGYFKLEKFNEALPFIEKAISGREKDESHLPENDKFKVLFGDKFTGREIYDMHAHIKLAQGIVFEALEIAERGRVRALADFLNSKNVLQSTAAVDATNKTTEHSLEYEVHNPSFTRLFYMVSGNDGSVISTQTPYSGTQFKLRKEWNNATIRSLRQTSYDELGTRSQGDCEDR